MTPVFANAARVYTVAYCGVVLVLSLLEIVVPRRPPAAALRLRWLGNVGVAILNAVVVRAILPVTAIAFATVCSDRGWGIFPHLGAPQWVTIAVTLLAMDFATYSEHVMMHRVDGLWRIHRAHHTDHDCDFTTGARFHPLEVACSAAVGFGVILVLGPTPAAVFAFQITAMLTTFVEHANVKLPANIDRAARAIIVTPDVHRIHHSRNARDSRSNFGTIFTWWDRLLGTYAHASEAGHERMVFGVSGFAEPRHLTLPWILAQPFLHHPDSTPAPDQDHRLQPASE